MIDSRTDHFKGQRLIHWSMLTRMFGGEPFLERFKSKDETEARKVANNYRKQRRRVRVVKAAGFFHVLLGPSR